VDDPGRHKAVDGACWVLRNASLGRTLAASYLGSLMAVAAARTKARSHARRPRPISGVPDSAKDAERAAIGQHLTVQEFVNQLALSKK
jgi:hypothetical protein